MLKKIMKSVLLIAIISTIGITTYCVASVKVTEQNLNEAFQKFINSDQNASNYKIKLDKGIMKIESNDGNYNVNYDLTNKPTFTVSIPIQKGMSYDEFQELTNSSILVELGYIAVANIEGADMKDATEYILFSSFFKGLNMKNDGYEYIIIDDSENTNNIQLGDNQKIIYKSEFPNKVMEYVNNLYKNKITMSDKDKLNSYTYSVERKEVTENSCKLITTLTVNPDVNFKKIPEYIEKIGMNEDITEKNADYVIKLKVGQKCNIKSNEEITGYSICGGNCINYDKEKNLITALEKGKCNGYLYFRTGDNQIKKSIYVIVEENTSDESLKPITLEINIDRDKGTLNNILSNKLPQTGEFSVIRNILELFIFAAIIVLLGVILKAIKDNE